MSDKRIEKNQELDAEQLSYTFLSSDLKQSYRQSIYWLLDELELQLSDEFFKDSPKTRAKALYDYLMHISHEAPRQVQVVASIGLEQILRRFPDVANK